VKDFIFSSLGSFLASFPLSDKMAFPYLGFQSGPDDLVNGKDCTGKGFLFLSPNTSRGKEVPAPSHRRLARFMKEARPKTMHNAVD
jgi:hypothetical protein